MNEELQLAPSEAPVIPVKAGVELRLVDPETAPEMFALVQKNLGRLEPFVAWADEVYSEEDRFKGFMFQLEQYNAGTAYPMTIWVDGKPAGMVDIRDIGSEEGAEVGCWIDEDHEGQRIVKDSLIALIDFARARHKIDRIRWTAMEDNDSSLGLAKSLGFEPVSITPITEGKFEGRNEVIYAKTYEPRQTG